MINVLKKKKKISHYFKGASYPKFFLDYSMDEFEKLTKLNYLGQAYVAHVG